MHPVAMGTQIRVLTNQNNHSYRLGGIYTVSQVDSDGTFRAADAQGRVGNWIRWDDCEPLGSLAWSRIAADLPEPLLRFLSCFDGIGELVFTERVIDAVLAKLPDLHERIVAAAATPAGQAAITGNQPQPSTAESNDQRRQSAAR